MRLAYGTYKHAIGQATLALDKQRVRTNDETDWATEVRATVTGMLATTKSNESEARADIKTQTAALEAAYAVGGKDLILYMPDGVTKSGLELLEADCLGGVKMTKPPSYTDNRGAQGVTYRTFAMEFTGLIPIPTSDLATSLVSFQETLDIVPDDRVGWIDTRKGYAVQQTLAQNPKWTAVQRGSAVGLYSYPPVPGPIFTFARVGDAPLVTKGSPRRIRGQNTQSHIDWPISWQWRFVWSTPLTGNPHIAGLTY